MKSEQYEAARALQQQSDDETKPRGITIRITQHGPGECRCSPFRLAGVKPEKSHGQRPLCPVHDAVDGNPI